MSSARRRGEIERLREEGREAFLAGRHIQTVPRQYIGTMDRYQWESGYQQAKDEAARDASVDIETELALAVEIIEALTDDDPCHFDHHGNCQAHAAFGDGECPHAMAKRWLARNMADAPAWTASKCSTTW